MPVTIFITIIVKYETCIWLVIAYFYELYTIVEAILNTTYIEVQGFEHEEVTLSFYEPPSLPPLLSIVWYKGQKHTNYVYVELVILDSALCLICHKNYLK